MREGLIFPPNNKNGFGFYRAKAPATRMRKLKATLLGYKTVY